MGSGWYKLRLASDRAAYPALLQYTAENLDTVLREEKDVAFNII